MTHSYDNRVCLSWVSFGVAAVAAGALVFSGCQRTSEATNTRAEPAAAKPEQKPLENKPAGDATPAPKVVPAVGEAKAEPPAVADKQEPESKTEPSESAADLAGTLTVKRLQVTGEIKDREPVETAALTVGGGILAFVEMSNKAEVEQTIVVTFEGADAKKVGFIELKVPAKQPRWRTWGQTKNIRSPGEWTAVVSTKDGTELSRTTFSVAEATVPAG